jgi:hypothetical protein
MKLLYTRLSLFLLDIKSENSGKRILAYIPTEVLCALCPPGQQQPKYGVCRTCGKPICRKHAIDIGHGRVVCPAHDVHHPNSPA